MANPAERPRASTPAPRGARRPRRPGRAPAAGGGVAFVEPRTVAIEKATDLGSVQVLKHGNL
jgi:hypothetical protein